MSKPLFDPAAYLRQLDPEVSYDCTFLTGGIVNVTARAVKTEPGTGRFPKHQSVVLKYAPPYVAGEGEKAPLTQYRQTIEALALSSFSPTGSLQGILDASTVAVPELLHHDTESHVLILSDLGPLPNLSDIFGELGGQTIGVPTPKLFEHDLFSGENDQLSSDQARRFEDMGTRLGTFFAHLHSPNSRAKVLKRFSRSQFQIPEIRDAVLEFAIKPVAKQIKLFPDLASVEEADFYGRLLEEDYARETLEDEESFVLGDSWTGAVLISPNAAAPYSESSTVAVIDWEFAALGRGAHGDIAQFLAHLKLFVISARQDSRFSKHEQALNLLINNLAISYAHTTLEAYDARIWRHDLSTLGPSTPKARKLRSAFLSLGAEMINVAFWKRWNCIDPKCLLDENGQHSSIQHKCVLVRNMVAGGLWFLKRARKGVETFCDNENWSDIRAHVLQLRERNVLGLVDCF